MAKMGQVFNVQTRGIKDVSGCGWMWVDDGDRVSKEQGGSLPSCMVVSTDRIQG